MSFDFEERLWSHILIKSADECWPPKNPGAIERNTYAQFNLGKTFGFKRITMPSAVLMIKLGRELRSGMQTCHTCHWKPCNNPSHLVEGTGAQNVRMNPPEVRARGGLANRGVKKRPEHGEKQRIAQFTSRMRTCPCGREMNAGALGTHQRATGHGGAIVNRTYKKWTGESREARLRTCSCGKVSTAGAMGRHLKATGHHLVTG